MVCSLFINISWIFTPKLLNKILKKNTKEKENEREKKSNECNTAERYSLHSYYGVFLKLDAPSSKIQNTSGDLNSILYKINIASRRTRHNWVFFTVANNAKFYDNSLLVLYKNFSYIFDD